MKRRGRLFPGLWTYRSLLSSLIKRNYQLRYRQSLAGFGWAIFPPIASLLVGTLVFHKVIGVKTDVPFYVFMMAGLVPWTFFASGLNGAVPSVVGSIQLVTRLNFPRSVLPLSMLGTSLIDLAIAGVLYVVVAIATGFGLRLSSLWFPVVLLIEIVFTTGIALWLSALNSFARDIRLAIPLAMQLWLFLTPVMYPVDQIPSNLRVWFELNPMTGLIQQFRLLLLKGRGLEIHLLAWPLIGSILVLALGAWYFGATEERFADVV